MNLLPKTKLDIAIITEGLCRNSCGGVLTCINDFLRINKNQRKIIINLTTRKNKRKLTNLRSVKVTNVQLDKPINFKLANKILPKINNKNIIFPGVKFDNLSKEIIFKYVEKLYSERENKLISKYNFFTIHLNNIISLINIDLAKIPIANFYHSFSPGYSSYLAVVNKNEHKSHAILEQHGNISVEQKLYLNELLKSYEPEEKQDFQNEYLKTFNHIIKYNFKHLNLTMGLDQSIIASQKLVGAKKVHLRRNALTKTDHTQKPHTSIKVINIAVIGRIVPSKNIEAVIFLVPLLLKEHDIRVYIKGPVSRKSSYYRYLQQLVRNSNTQNHIIFTGQQDYHQLYSNIDLILHPSNLEAQSMVILEAMQAKIPIIARPIAANKKILIDCKSRPCGLFSDFKNINQLSQYLTMVKNDDTKINQIISNGKAKVQKFHSKEILIKVYQSAYRRASI